MRISCWRAKQDVTKLDPKIIVYTWILHDDSLGDILCDTAWSTQLESHEHFWYGQQMRISPLTLSLEEYIKRHFEEIRGMNPFWDLGRLEFLDKWNQYWKVRVNES